jgi:hypothetical protein
VACGFQYATDCRVRTKVDWTAFGIGSSLPRTRLVVVDVLAMFKPARGDRENLYERTTTRSRAPGARGRFNIAMSCASYRKSGSDVDVREGDGTLGLSAQRTRPSSGRDAAAPRFTAVGVTSRKSRLR